MKIGVLIISLNETFIPYTRKMLETARPNLFPGHEVEFLMWSDTTDWPDCTLFEIDATPWPFPTLMRYHLFLQQETYLKKFDKLLYIDADMEVKCPIGMEIFGDWLTCAKHPMYALDRRFIPPYEPNPGSAAYIGRFGQILTDNRGKYWFDPIYAAGGLQGGTTQPFIDAMWWMKRSIDRDLQNNYVAIWNDESHWNAYLAAHPNDALIILGPDYVYPDSLIKEYYEPIWGRKYTPKIVTVTKKHSLTKQGGADLARMLGQDVPQEATPVVCPTCHDVLSHPAGHFINKIILCRGQNQPHDCEMLVLASSMKKCPTCGDLLPGTGITSVTSCGGIGGLHGIESSV